MDARATVLACFIIAAVLWGCDSPVISLSEPPVTVQSETGGSGRPAKDGDMVVIDYRVLLPDGQQVLAATNYQFMLGQGAVIGGVDDAVLGMKAGGRRIVNCPPHRHW